MWKVKAVILAKFNSCGNENKKIFVKMLATFKPRDFLFLRQFLSITYASWQKRTLSEPHSYVLTTELSFLTSSAKYLNDCFWTSGCAFENYSNTCRIMYSKEVKVFFVNLINKKPYIYQTLWMGSMTQTIMNKMKWLEDTLTSEKILRMIILVHSCEIKGFINSKCLFR